MAGKRTALEDNPFPIPPAEGGLAAFPERVPWATPIFEMSNWWLTVNCTCGEKQVPLRLLAARIGWRITLREIVPFLRCATCRQRPTNVQLVDDPSGDVGRFGAKMKRLQLHP
jgi:hypothetical protein